MDFCFSYLSIDVNIHTLLSLKVIYLLFTLNDKSHAKLIFSSVAPQES